MPEGLGPRLAIENGFLILLAVGGAVADLDPIWIVVVMAIGWFLVALVELLAWRVRPAHAWAPVAPDPRHEVVAAYAPVPRGPPVELSPEYPPAPLAADDDSEVAGPDAPADEDASASSLSAGRDDEHTTTLFQRPEARRERVRLDPLRPRPKRRLFSRRTERPEPVPPEPLPPGEEAG